MTEKKTMDLENSTISSTTNPVTGSTVPLVERGSGGVRKVQALLLFLCFFTAYFLRTNLSVGIVAMTNRNSTNSNFEEFAWDENTKGKILSSFYWGYLVIQVPAGLMGQNISPKTLLIVTNTLCSLLTLIIPVGAHYGGWMTLCGIRVLQGLCQGFYVPLTYTLASKWAPLTEQNRFIGFTLNGGTLGATAVMPMSGYLASSSGGWPSIFYVSGIIGLLWVVLWVFKGADSPATHSNISQSEKEYIMTSLQHNSEQNGLLSAIPYLTMWLVSYPVFWLADIMYQKQICSTTHLRKIWATVSGTGAALTLIAVTLVGRDPVAAMILLVIAISLSSCAFSGFYVNSLDLAPNFAGVLTGIGNGLENISSILAPLSVGWIINDNTSVHQWMFVFLLAAVVDITGNVIFLIWGTAELQSWNEPKVKEPTSTQMTMSTLRPPPYVST
ncbi:putative inorganic phosphate cotransporter isoform X2 [Lycorma delicatula]|uniref:putative inorganic phosphate cotransporter isoform X2 n=1 Tax=Lycorma delicatula TaxID=130591 RepID=UPI003F51A18E